MSNQSAAMRPCFGLFSTSRSPRPEDADHAALDAGAQGREDGLEGRGRMGVVDDDLEGLTPAYRRHAAADRPQSGEKRNEIAYRDPAEARDGEQ